MSSFEIKEGAAEPFKVARFAYFAKVISMVLTFVGVPPSSKDAN
jgi:hypothetical protein